MAEKVKCDNCFNRKYTIKSNMHLSIIRVSNVVTTYYETSPNLSSILSRVVSVENTCHEDNKTMYEDNKTMYRKYPPETNYSRNTE